MDERVLPYGWIAGRSIERRSVADTRLRIIGTGLYASGRPTSVVFDQRSIWAAMVLGILPKPNRSRATRIRKTSPNK